jgi:stage III sporulation protein AF
VSTKVENIKEWITGIITMTIFISLIEIILPSGKMKKYVSLFTGFILIGTILNPIGKFVGKKEELIDLDQYKNQFDNWEVSDVKQSKKLEEQVVKVYRDSTKRKIEEILNDLGGMKECKINFDSDSSRFDSNKKEKIQISARIDSNENAELKRARVISELEKKLDIDRKNLIIKFTG